MHVVSDTSVVSTVNTSRLIKGFSFLAFTFYALYAAYYTSQGDYFFTYLYLGTLLWIILNIIFYIWKRHETLALYGLAALGLPALVPWQITGGIGGTGIYSYYLYVVWLFFLFGKREGLYWVSVVSLTSLCLFFLQVLGVVPSFYSNAVMVSFYVNLFVQVGMLTVYQASKEKADNELLEQSKQLEAKSIELSSEVKQREQSEMALQARADELEKIKSATLNLLEDLEAEKNRTVAANQDLAKFKLAVESTADQVVITNADGRILYANRAVEPTTGFSPEEIIGKKVGTKELWGGQMSSDFYQGLWHTLKVQ